MDLNSQWIEERKKWICLTPISGLCSQTLLYLIWGVGTGFGAHKGKKRGIFPWSRECFLDQRLGAAGSPLQLAFCLLVTVWKVCALLRGEGGLCFKGSLLRGASWGSCDCTAQNSFAVWIIRHCLAMGRFVSVHLSTCILISHSPIPGPTGIPYRAFQRLPYVRYSIYHL